MHKQSEKKKIGGTIVGVVVGMLVVLFAQQMFFKAPTYDKSLVKIADEFNKNCPFMLDEETRLDNAIAPGGNILQYNCTLIGVEKDSMDIAYFEGYMQPLLLNNIKTNPGIKEFRDNKVGLAYHYKDKNDVFITKILINPAQYEE